MKSASSTEKDYSGPWHVSVNDAEPPRVADCTDFHVCTIMGPNNAGWAIDNARLIAAAPDMLQMLISAYALLAGSQGSQQFEDQCGYMAEQISGVIIKATGHE